MPKLTPKSRQSKSASQKSGGDSEIVRFDRVGFRYGRGPEILSDVSFTLKRGSFSFLTGQSGAGKSTLLKLCYMDLKPSRGLIDLFEIDASGVSRNQRQGIRRKIGVVLQDFQLIDHLNIFENVALPLRVTGQSRANYGEDVAELLNWVGLGDRMQAMPRTLSGGEKQRAAIARAVISKPDLLIADEPTGNVDPVIAKRLLRLFSEMNRMGTTVLIATHDLGLLDEVPADCYTIKDNQLTRGIVATS